MTDEIVQDLKQFIAATISRQTSEIVGRLERVENRLSQVETLAHATSTTLTLVVQKIDNLSMLYNATATIIPAACGN